jgi:glycosyltransferase involved in cell wall biosynthesis
MAGNQLAVFTGQAFWRDGDGYSTGESFIRFIEAFAELYGQVTLLVRVEARPGRGSYPLDPRRFRVVELPPFEQFNPVQVARAWPRVRRILRDQLPPHGAVWIGGPHLVGWQVLRLCRQAGIPCFLMIRQNLIEQVRHKARGVKRIPALAITALLEGRFRAAARHIPTFTVGRMMYREYGGESHDNVHEVCINLLRANDIPATVPARAEKPRSASLLWVGRLSAEKGLPVLLQALGRLPADGTAPTLTLVGTGPQEDELREMTADLGLDGRVQFAGYVPFGPALAEYYRRADLFVLPSLTGEGLPQVLLEAMAAGVPCIATAVEGIPFFIDDQRDGVLVPPADAGALTAAIEELLRDPERCRQLSAAGLEKVRDHSLEVERGRMVAVLEETLALRPRHEAAA